MQDVFRNHVAALHGDNLGTNRTHKSVGKPLRSSDRAESLSGLPSSRIAGHPMV